MARKSLSLGRRGIEDRANSSGREQYLSTLRALKALCASALLQEHASITSRSSTVRRCALELDRPSTARSRFT